MCISPHLSSLFLFLWCCSFPAAVSYRDLWKDWTSLSQGYQRVCSVCVGSQMQPLQTTPIAHLSTCETPTWLGRSFCCASVPLSKSCQQPCRCCSCYVVAHNGSCSSARDSLDQPVASIPVPESGGGQCKAENAAADGRQLQKSRMWRTWLHRSEHRRVLFMSLAVQGIRIWSFFSPHVR